MPELHHIGRVTYEAWKAAVLRQRPSDPEAPFAYPNEWVTLGAAEQDAWQAAGVAVRGDGWAIQ